MIKQGQVLTTRVALKTDRVDRWERSTKILLNGEVAISYELDDDKITKKNFRIKIGTGNKTWKQLQFMKILDLSDELLNQIKAQLNIPELKSAIERLEDKVNIIETALNGMSIAEIRQGVLKLKDKIEFDK